MPSRLCRVLLAATAAASFVHADDVVLATFDEAPATSKTWKEMNDPVMGGKSTGTFSVENGLGIFDGEVVDVPFLHAPGFIKADTVDSAPFPDVSHCSAVKLLVKSDTAFGGFRFAFGDAHAPHGKFFAYGYKSQFVPPVGEFGDVVIPFNNFTDYWDDATGEPIKTCSEGAIYCPDVNTLQNMKTMSVWAEGKAGKVHLELKAVKATGCTSKTDVMV